jgi:ribose 5-phosphate isomerase A
MDQGRLTGTEDDPAVQAVAGRALELVQDGARVGLGSGRAAEQFIRALATSRRHVRCVATSSASAALATGLGLTVVTLDDVSHLDLTVDGADEVDPRLNLIKGYGRAMVREKIVAAASKHRVYLVGPEKLVPVLGARGRLPVEVLRFGLAVVRGKLEEMGIPSTPVVADDGELWFSDNGNVILTCQVGPIADPVALERQITSLPGVVGTGLFLGMADAVLVQNGDQLEVRQKPVVG